MNKCTGLVGLMLLSVSTLASANGFYVGGGVGVLQLKNIFTDAEWSTDVYNTEPYLSTSASGYDTGINKTLLAGYEWEDPKGYFVGLEIFDNMTSANTSATESSGPGDAMPVKLKIKSGYGIRVLPGYHLTPATVGYGIIGVMHGRMQSTYEQTGYQQTYNLRGYQVGLGAMTHVSEHIAVRGDLIYTGYQKTTVYSSDSSLDFPINNSSSIQPSTVEADINLMYQFG